MKLLLHDMEHIRDTYHEAGVVIMKPVLIALAVFAVPWYFALRYGITGRFRIILLLIGMGALIYAMRALIIWRLNSYIITNKRLVKLSHDGLFKRTVIETPHERILNVSYKTTGLMSVLFRHGDVEVQVVGLVEPIILKNIERPAAVKDYLWQLHGRVVKKEGVYDSDDIAHVQEQVGYTKKNQRIL